MDITGAQLVNDLIVVAGVFGSLFGAHKAGWFARAVAFIQKEEPVIAEVVDTALHSPTAKVVEAKLRHDLDNAASDLEKTQLGKLAAEALHGIGIAYSALSVDQKKAIVLLLSTKLPNIPQADIEKALELAQHASEEFAANSIIQSANKFTQDQIDAQIRATKVEATPAQVSAQA